MSDPVLTELSSAAFPGYAVGDPLGDGNFTPAGGKYTNGLIRARVTGSFTDLHVADADAVEHRRKREHQPHALERFGVAVLRDPQVHVLCRAAGSIA